VSVNPCRWINHWNNATPGLRLPSQRYQLILIGDREAHACEQLAWVIRESGTDDSPTRNFWVENANHYTTRPHDWQPIPTEFAVLSNSYNTTSNPRFSLKSGFLGRDMRIKIKLYVTTWRNFSHNLPNSCCCQVAFAENLKISFADKLSRSHVLQSSTHPYLLYFMKICDLDFGSKSNRG